MEHDVLIYTLLYKRRQYQRDKNTPKISCGQIGIQMKTTERESEREREKLRSEKWFNIGVNSAIRTRYTTHIIIMETS